MDKDNSTPKKCEVTVATANNSVAYMQICTCGNTCPLHPPTPQESWEVKPLDKLYALYLDGRKKYKDPVGYIDYHKVATLYLNEIEAREATARQEGYREGEEDTKRMCIENQ